MSLIRTSLQEEIPLILRHHSTFNLKCLKTSLFSNSFTSTSKKTQSQILLLKPLSINPSPFAPCCFYLLSILMSMISTQKPTCTLIILIIINSRKSWTHLHLFIILPSCAATEHILVETSPVLLLYSRLLGLVSPT